MMVRSDVREKRSDTLHSVGMDDCAATANKGGQVAAQKEEDVHAGGSKAAPAQIGPLPHIEEADNPNYSDEYFSSDAADTTESVMRQAGFPMVHLPSPTFLH
jgi:hypothetical protein